MELDERFSKLGKDHPCYKKIPTKERKVKIDARFENMFKDERFNTTYSIDKRGKVISVVEVEDLHRFYDLDNNNKSENEVDVNKKEVGVPMELNYSVFDGKKIKIKKVKKKGKLLASVTGKNIQLSNGARLSGKKKKRTKLNGGIRGETLPDHNSDSDESNQFSEGEMNEDEIIHGWGDLDESVQCIENAETSRLAVCNCDWDKIGANDLFVLFDSFKPVDGVIKSVKVYPSEFGIERMKEEKFSGPKELRETAIDSDNEENEEGLCFDMEKLREYQLNRLKYYYAVVECNSAETANKIYKELDGKEYEMSATRLDLRFIPEYTIFDCEPKSVASGMSQLKNYEPISYYNTALQQSTVRLTWDEMDTRRVQATMRKFTKDDIENMDFKCYLASSSSENEEGVDSKMKNLDNEGKKIDDIHDDGTERNEENKRIQIYKQLMQEIESKEEKNNDKQGIEVSFKTNMGNDTDKISNFTEIPVKNSIMQKNEETKISFNSDSKNYETSDEEDNHEDEDLLAHNKDEGHPQGKRNLNESEEKMTESKKKKKNELELLLLDKSEDKKHFSLKNILIQEKSKMSKRKRKKEKEVKEEGDGFKINVIDPRFSAVYSSHLYALDPSEPNFKNTKSTEAIIEESQRQRKKNERENVIDKISTSTEDKLDSRLHGLIKSVKSKTELHKWKKERKKVNM